MRGDMDHRYVVTRLAQRSGFLPDAGVAAEVERSDNCDAGGWHHGLAFGSLSWSQDIQRLSCAAILSIVRPMAWS